MKDLAHPQRTGQVAVDGDWTWFRGHFPEDPILPGVAQLQMVLDLLAAHGEARAVLTGLGRIKFRRIVRPGEVLDIAVSPPDDEHRRRFSITCGNDTVCSGTMLFTPNRTRHDDMSDKITETITRISEIIINELKLEDVTAATFNPDLDLVDEVGVDSMDLATVALVLRDEFGIRIDEDDYPKLSTVRIIAQYILDKQNSGE